VGAGGEKKREEKKIRCTMVTPVTMEIMVHSEMGRLDFEKEGKGGVCQSWEHKFIKQAFQMSQELQGCSIVSLFGKSETNGFSSPEKGFARYHS